MEFISRSTTVALDKDEVERRHFTKVEQQHAAFKKNKTKKKESIFTYKARGAYTLVYTASKNAKNPLISKGVLQ